MTMKILGIVGSYRKNGIIDRLVTETLSSAEASGAATKKLYLTDAHIEFCTNCRRCMQEPGTDPGKCIHADDFSVILKEWRESDGLVIGAPVNFYNVTAVTRKFMSDRPEQRSMTATAEKTAAQLRMTKRCFFKNSPHATKNETRVFMAIVYQI